MLHNLKAEIVRHNIKKTEIAKCLNIGNRTLYGKIKGETKFTTDEAFKIQKTFFPECTLDYLFEQSDL